MTFKNMKQNKRYVRKLHAGNDEAKRIIKSAKKTLKKAEKTLAKFTGYTTEPKPSIIDRFKRLFR